LEVEKKIEAMGLKLPPTPVPRSNHVDAVRVGNLLFVGGHSARRPDGTIAYEGKVDREVTVEQAYESARDAALKCLSTIKHNIGDLDKVKQIVKLLCMVNTVPEFSEPARVANGASDLLVNLYGDRGHHARSAVGMATLPFQAPAEIEMIVEVED
jgi:enamine deaminase RidA (YjgF/YER057c/UK114 family)